VDRLQAAGIRTGTDADAFYTSRGGVPSLNISILNRYMHTPVKLADIGDLDVVTELLVATVTASSGLDSFAGEL